VKKTIGAVWINSVFLLGIVMSCSARSRQPQAATNQSFRRVTFCTLLADPKTYTGQALEVVARVTATKEGIDMWDPLCGKSGIDLSVDFDATNRAGFKEFEAALKEHGLSDRPVIATIRGVFVFNQYDKTRHQSRSIFTVDSVGDVHQANDVERRPVVASETIKYEAGHAQDAPVS